MSHRRQLASWIGLAGVALAAFFAIMHAQYEPTQQRFALAVTPHPAAGRELFTSKGCSSCHGEDGIGGRAPSLRERASLQSLPRLVTAVWDHVPRMSEAIRSSGMQYPAMSSEEMAQLFAYLYIVGVTDLPGDAVRGRALFESKGCARCHAAASASAPAFAELSRAQTPLALTEALWNHASGMSAELQHRRMQWPAMKSGELRDLFAYVQTVGGNKVYDGRTGDPARGWQVFQTRSCMTCHALAGRPALEKTVSQATAVNVSANPGPRPLGSEALPATVSRFGEVMLNHFPEMERVMAASGKQPPSFAPGEFTDLAVFLYSLRYEEPTGSPHVGASVFQWRGCASCHGSNASGGSGPALRGRGQNYTAVRLATGLWRHGAQMYQLTQRTGQAWPELQESDIGDLLAFLNTPIEKK
ncbi:MAG: c-type cytochrome [Terriglobales bacterium]